MTEDLQDASGRRTQFCMLSHLILSLCVCSAGQSVLVSGVALSQTRTAHLLIHRMCFSCAQGQLVHSIVKDVSLVFADGVLELRFLASRASIVQEYLVVPVSCSGPRFFPCPYVVGPHCVAHHAITLWHTGARGSTVLLRLHDTVTGMDSVRVVLFDRVFKSFVKHSQAVRGKLFHGVVFCVRHRVISRTS